MHNNPEIKNQVPLKVLMLVPSFPQPGKQVKGGVHAAVQNLLQGFGGLKLQVRLVSIDWSVREKYVQQLSGNVEIVYQPIRKRAVRFLSYLLDGPGILQQQLNSFRPDILHYQIGGNFLLTSRGLKSPPVSLLTIHGIAYREAKVARSLRKKLNMYWNGTVTRIMMPAHIINISEYSRSLFRSPVVQTGPVIRNAVSDGFFDIPAAPRMENRLLYVGVVSERKNLLVLLRAMKQMKEKNIRYQLDIVGGADAQDTYYETVRLFAEEHLNGQVTFHGWKSQEEVKLLLEQSNILVLPSRQETLPMSVAEAMAAGRIVIASAVGGLPEMITHGQTGFLFEPDAVEDLVSILSSLQGNEYLCQEIATKGRGYAKQHYSAATVAAKTLEYYYTLLSRTATHP